ncbi:hypothetical protein Alg215_09874 [Pyrenophora tritici-repentis]|nr:hypothetical protein Alg215_09874 [Pyrenophora tritici-repentis]
MSHTATSHLVSTYREAYKDAVWTYCPLANDKVKEVWWVHPDTLRESALI